MQEFLPGILALLRGNDSVAAELLNQAGTPAQLASAMAKAPVTSPAPVPAEMPTPSVAPAAAPVPIPTAAKAQIPQSQVANAISASAASPEMAALPTQQEEFIRALAGLEAPPSGRPPNPGVVAPRGGGSVQPNAIRALLGLASSPQQALPTLGNLFKR